MASVAPPPLDPLVASVDIVNGVATKFCLSGEVGFIGTQTHLPPKFSFYSDFGHLIMLKKGNFYTFHEKKYTEISKFLGNCPPRFSKIRPDPCDPPSATPLQA